MTHGEWEKRDEKDEKRDSPVCLALVSTLFCQFPTDETWLSQSGI